jgi:hypothetical protein
MPGLEGFTAHLCFADTCRSCFMSMLICNAKPMQFDSRVAPSIFTQLSCRFGNDDKVLFSHAHLSSV